MRTFNPFHPEFLKWSIPLLYLDMSIVVNTDVNQNQNGMANIADPDGSRSTLFAQVSGFVCRAES